MIFFGPHVQALVLQTVARLHYARSAVLADEARAKPPGLLQRELATHVAAEAQRSAAHASAQARKALGITH